MLDFKKIILTLTKYMTLFEQFESQNTLNPDYQISYGGTARSLQNALKKATIYLGRELPKELNDFYSISAGIFIYWSEKNTFKYNPSVLSAKLNSLNELFCNFKPNPIDIPLGSTYDEIDQYIKKSHPFSNLFPIEPAGISVQQLDLYNTIRKQKVLVRLFGSSDLITIDFDSDATAGYQVNYLNPRNLELVKLDLTFDEFVDYYSCFGAFGDWYLGFIATGEKINLQLDANFDELVKHFGHVPFCQDKISMIKSMFAKKQEEMNHIQ